MCFTRAAGVYPIRWHYTMDDGSFIGGANTSSMHINYCAGTCTPAVAIPASMLRVSP